MNFLSISENDVNSRNFKELRASVHVVHIDGLSTLWRSLEMWLERCSMGVRSHPTATWSGDAPRKVFTGKTVGPVRGC